jgi:hypothetical protein
MLEIRRVGRYTTAKYPQGCFVQPSVLPRSLAKRGTVSALMLVLLEACSGEGGTGLTGPPPIIPTLVTENEARQVIEQTFGVHGVSFDEDVRFVLNHGPNDSTELQLDGFNDSLQVGYEYIYDLDALSFTPRAQSALDSLVNENGPYIKPINAVDHPEIIRQVVEEFIDTLKANGII